MLHGKKTDRGRKRDTLTIKFLKKYIHYAKNRIEPDLTDEASEQIATTYAELRNASSNAKTGGTLPITARTLETIIRLSTAHAKLKLSRKVSKSDVDAALKVLNFAIYHKELTDMEEREQERERELERNGRPNHSAGQEGADHSAGQHDGSGNGTTNNQDSTTEPMDVDPRTESAATNNSSERLKALTDVLNQVRTVQRSESISVEALENAVNDGASVPYSRAEITFLLEELRRRNIVMVDGGTVFIIS
ncbi:hypothetical protein ACFX14_004819 [Malus domestica]